MQGIYILLLTLVFIFGCVIGSFLNVCILRIPNHEDITTTRSHCTSCGNDIKWYDLVPVVSFICLKGKCRHCQSKISVQYPIIELLNGCLYCTITVIMGLTITTILTCLLASCLIVIAVVDWRTFEIPVGLNVFIGILGLVNLVIDYKNWLLYLIGAVLVSGFLLILFVVSKGRAIGGGDIKLMAAAGLLLGWKNILVAFVIGCVLASVIHIIRMKISKKDHMLAFGPYLSVGILISQVFGSELIKMYMSLYS